MMVYSTVAVYLAVIIGLCVTPGHSVCNHGDLPGIEDGEQLSITSQTNYSTGDLAVYSCDGSEAANYGYVVVKCTVAGWDEPDRNCDDPAVVGGGTIIGFCFFGFTAILEVSLLSVTSYRHHKNKKTDELKKRLELAAAASYGSTSCTTSEAGDCYDNKSGKTKQSDC